MPKCYPFKNQSFNEKAYCPKMDTVSIFWTQKRTLILIFLYLYV